MCKYQSKIQRHISLGQDAAFQVEVAAKMDGVTSCQRKRLVKEQITIYTDSQAAVVALVASGTKSLLVADCLEKLTVLSVVNQVPNHSVGSWAKWNSEERDCRQASEGGSED